MNPADAKRIVLMYHDRTRINAAFLAEKLGVAKGSVANWLSGRMEPRDESQWVRMAEVMGLRPTATPLGEAARELALLVLVKSKDDDLRAAAGKLIQDFF